MRRLHVFSHQTGRFFPVWATENQ